MCTFIGKVTARRIVLIQGTPCCLRVEDIQAINPKISRANGWEELPIDVGGWNWPEWTHWTLHKKDGRLPHNLPRTRDDGRKVAWLDLSEDIQRHIPSHPVAALTYRRRTIHFWNWDTLRVLRAYVADSQRKPQKYPGYERYLSVVPKEFLRAHDRPKVLKKLDAKLAAEARSV